MGMTSIAAAIRDMLMTPDAHRRVMAARCVARDWRLGQLSHVFDVSMPDRPVRPPAPELLPPNRMPKRGKGGSLANRIALIHSLAHIEFVAIDLAFDMAGRFGAGLPRAFIDDWMKVGADEAMHFALLDRRLKQLGSHYGAHPAHDGLWEAAEATRHDILARLAVVPMVLEARGLDVTPATRDRFHAFGDTATARILDRILADEIIHVGTGSRWFAMLCEAQKSDPAILWPKLVRHHFRGLLKPPFNDSARESAGLTRELYQSLAYPPALPQ
jgi:uncharacterized ferritin-like protein (DUF455 family)